MNIYISPDQHPLRSYKEKIKYSHDDSENNILCWTSFIDSQLQSSNGKKYQLINQAICEAIKHFTTCTWRKNEHKIAGDILPDISSENGRRKPYASLIQDSRRR
jgi:hypothetical protein